MANKPSQGMSGHCSLVLMVVDERELPREQLLNFVFHKVNLNLACSE